MSRNTGRNSPPSQNRQTFRAPVAPPRPATPPPMTARPAPVAAPARASTPAPSFGTPGLTYNSGGGVNNPYAPRPATPAPSGGGGSSFTASPATQISNTQIARPVQAGSSSAAAGITGYNAGGGAIYSSGSAPSNISPTFGVTNTQALNNLSAQGFNAPTANRSVQSTPASNSQGSMQAISAMTGGNITRPNSSQLGFYQDKTNPGADNSIEAKRRRRAAAQAALSGVTAPVDTPEATMPPPVDTAEQSQEDPFLAQLRSIQESFKEPDYSGVEQANNALQAQEDALNNSLQGISQQTIPMEFITGQQASVRNAGINALSAKTGAAQNALSKYQAALEGGRQKQTTALQMAQIGQQHSQNKALMAQSAQQNALQALQSQQAFSENQRQFGVTSGISQQNANSTQANVVADNALAQQQFAENKRQFGANYAQKALEMSMGQKKENAKNAATPMTLDQMTFLEDTANKVISLSKKSGPSDITKKIGDTFVGSSGFRQLEALTNTLRTNVLTLADPNIKKFFGPMMSNSDVKLMTAANTTLNPESQSPAQMREEATRLLAIFKEMTAAVKQGAGTPQAGQAPAGYYQASDGKFYKK